MGLRVLIVIVSVISAACGGAATTTPSTNSTTTTPTSTTSATGVAPCLEGSSGFFGDGPLGSQARDAADAATVTGLTLDTFEGCERLTIELAAASGAPATSLGTTEAEFIRRSGVVRIHLDPNINNTTISDIVFDGGLAGRAYVVRDFDESLFVDIHLVNSSVARFSEVPNPARLEVDLAPGGAEVGTPERDNFVVTMPLPTVVTAPVTIDGYGRTFEANVVLRARQSGVIVAEDSTTSTDYLETWGRFEITLPGGITGLVEIFIGEDSARDGAEQGVRFEMTIEG
jgi:hypothetical protein